MGSIISMVFGRRMSAGQTADKANQTNQAYKQIPFLFIWTGLAFYILLQLFTLFQIDLFSGASMRVPAGWGWAHLGALGWASMIAMGAIYQLLNVVLQRKIFSEKLGYAHFAAYTLGVIGMVLGFTFFQVKLLIVAAALAALGIGLFGYNLLATLLLAKSWNNITRAVLISILSLLLTAMTGMMMGLDFGFAFFAKLHQQIFASHLWFGAVGWFGILIVGFSYKLLPMFLLAHDYPQKHEKWIVALITAGMAGMTLSLLLELGTPALWSSLVLMTAGFTLYAFHVKGMWQHKHKKTPGAGILTAIWIVWLTACFFIAVTLLTAVWPELWHNGTFLRGAVYFYLVVWVNGSVLSYMSKIVPFLWWTHKYSSQLGKPGVPALGDLFKEDHYPYVLRGIIVLQAIFAALMMANFSAYAVWLQVPMAVLAIVYAGQLANIFRK